jgi:hypothetical protein
MPMIGENGKDYNSISFSEKIRMSLSTMSQADAVARFSPMIEEKGRDYAKFTRVEARPEKVGEKIDTHTGDGKETTNTAKEGDMVLCNIDTAAKEEYILSADKLAKRYKELGEGSRDGWKLYQATGEFRGYEYHGEEMHFIATWGEEMVLKDGDMIGTPLPGKNEVYRIAKAEFLSTYREKK